MNIWTLLLLAALAACLLRLRRQSQTLAEQQRQLQELNQQRGNLEHVLERRGRRLDVLFSAVNEAVMRVDRLGRVLALNAQANRVFQPSPLIELPQSMLLFYRNPAWHKSFADALKRLPEASALPDIEVGEWVLASRLAPLGKEQALLLCVDITEQARLEKQRRIFLSNLMHDLKTPLTSLLGYARSIQAFGDDEGLRQEAAQVIADEAKHVNSLLDALLTLDQIEFGGRPVGAHCDATHVVRQACEACKPQLVAKSIRLQLQCPEQAMVAMAEDDLHRCLGNVLDNALRHTSDGGEINVGVSVEGGHCTIDIGDDGPGIPVEHLDRITERFYRVDASRNRALGGHGLGLAIVKETLLIYGADVRFANRRPHGLCVQLMIPRVKAC
jgi:two-component system phosphate regulon sensor histidine kinase PhoR